MVLPAALVDRGRHDHQVSLCSDIEPWQEADLPFQPRHVLEKELMPAAASSLSRSLGKVAPKGGVCGVAVRAISYSFPLFIEGDVKQFPARPVCNTPALWYNQANNRMTCSAASGRSGRPSQGGLPFFLYRDGFFLSQKVRGPLPLLHPPTQRESPTPCAPDSRSTVRRSSVFARSDRTLTTRTDWLGRRPVGPRR